MVGFDDEDVVLRVPEFLYGSLMLDGLNFWAFSIVASIAARG